jgi:hypothetical protein
MASPLRRSTPSIRRARTTEFELLDTVGDADTTPPARQARLRVAGAPELVTDDDHPDFAHLPRHRRR